MGPQIDEPRLKRIGKNEAAFKAFNQARATEQQTSTLDLVCECGDTTCTEELEMKAADYHPVRRHPTRFVVLPGHEIPAAESVVERAPGYYIVEKKGPAEEASRGGRAGLGVLGQVVDVERTQLLRDLGFIRVKDVRDERGETHDVGFGLSRVSRCGFGHGDGLDEIPQETDVEVMASALHRSVVEFLG